MQFGFPSLTCKISETQPNHLIFFKMKVQLSALKWHNNNTGTNDSSTAKNELVPSIAKMRHGFSDKRVSKQDLSCGLVVKEDRSDLANHVIQILAPVASKHMAGMCTPNDNGMEK